MTEDEFDEAMDNNSLDQEYWDHIVDVGVGEIPLHEDAIYQAMEDGKYYESFKESMVKNEKVD